MASEKSFLKSLMSTLNKADVSAKEIADMNVATGSHVTPDEAYRDTCTNVSDEIQSRLNMLNSRD